MAKRIAYLTILTISSPDGNIPKWAKFRQAGIKDKGDNNGRRTAFGEPIPDPLDVSADRCLFIPYARIL